jgi:hypothetical protein
MWASCVTLKKGTYSQVCFSDCVFPSCFARPASAGYSAQIAVPPEDSAEHVVEFEERHVIGDRDQADDHLAHLAQNRTQNQAFEADCFSHLSRVPRIARPPTF